MVCAGKRFNGCSRCRRPGAVPIPSVLYQPCPILPKSRAHKESPSGAALPMPAKINAARAIRLFGAAECPFPFFVRRKRSSRSRSDSGILDHDRYGTSRKCPLRRIKVLTPSKRLGINRHKACSWFMTTSPAIRRDQPQPALACTDFASGLWYNDVMETASVVSGSRMPRFRRAPEPPAFRLTENDVEIIRQIARHRFLRSTHIAALVGRSIAHKRAAHISFTLGT